MADAALIVRAVNAHDALVEACKAISDAFPEDGSTACDARGRVLLTKTQAFAVWTALGLAVAALELARDKP